MRNAADVLERDVAQLIAVTTQLAEPVGPRKWRER
jgi:hypothetical protein